MVTLLRYLIDQRAWKEYETFLSHFRKAAQELASAEGPLDLACVVPQRKTYQAWYYGKRRPQVDSRRVLVHLFGHTVDELWGAADGNRALGLTSLTSTSQIRAHTDTDMDLHTMRRTGAMAARRAMEFALGAEREQVGDETLGYLGDEVKRITELYPRVPLSTVWADLATAQEEAFRLMESGRTRPSQARDLHFMACVLSFLMAKGSHDMGDPKTAMMQARAAGFCARQAEHPGLIALIDGLKSLIAYWSDKPEDALHYARKGAEESVNLRGTVAIWLAGLEARAAAVLGNEQAVQAANRRSAELRELVVADDLDALGGLLTYPVIKQTYYTVESAVLLGWGNAQIAAEAEEAVHGYSNRDDPAWAFGDLAGSRCNLALVHLHGGNLDGAAEAIRPVLDLPPSHRNSGIVVSAARVRAALTQQPVRNALLARDLREEIAMYQPARPSLPR
ncbi:hypothetical protein ABT039_09645 [Streptomyces lasiicapitis]|uniref:hypothetical protein n=1 Tax=Streptomyces lasiicapitis TaxID=1923961 RepID=UPI003330F827